MGFASAMPSPRSWPAILLMGLASALGAAAQGADDFLVRNLPGMPEGSNITMHAGHLEVDPQSDANLFFWHFGSERVAEKKRTIIWLNGGPGCSSEDGALMEIGPFRVKEDHTLNPNLGSWNEFADLLFVDNPVGTGFSYVDTDSFLEELSVMAVQFVAFLEKWFATFPDSKDHDIYLAGESYAGQHIPYIARAMLKHNEGKAPQDAWNLKGLLIGNGWISPADQYPAYVDFAHQRGLLEEGSSADQQVEVQLSDCQSAFLNFEGKVDYDQCEAVLTTILRLTRTEGDGPNEDCINMYDVRLKDPTCGMDWPPDLKQVTSYLRTTEVVNALHVNPEKNTGWTECSGAVGLAFKNWESPPSITFLPELIEEIPVLLFSGADDLICNHLGTETMIDNMEWNGALGFQTAPGHTAPRQVWTVEGMEAGFWQEARNLTYVLFKDSSHMVPFNYPRRTLDMVNRFMGIDQASVGGKVSGKLEEGKEADNSDSDNSGADNSLPDWVNDQAPSTDEDDGQSSDWASWQRSGEIVLVIVVVAAGAWLFIIWRARRRRAAYRAVSGDEPGERGFRMNGMRRKQQPGDLEAAAFEDGELDDFHVESPGVEEGKYAIGDDSDDDDETQALDSRGKHRGGSGSRSAS